MGPSDIIIKGDHQRTIPEKFGLNWPSGFRREDQNVKSLEAYPGNIL